MSATQTPIRCPFCDRALINVEDRGGLYGYTGDCYYHGVVWVDAEPSTDPVAEQAEDAA